MLLTLALAHTAAAQVYEEQWSLTHRWRDTPEAYFEGGARPLLLDTLGGASALDRLDYDVGDQRATLYVPDGEPPADGWAVLVHIDADRTNELPASWQDVLVDQRMIYVAVHDVGNDQSVVLRVAWSLDALASVEAAYPVDPERRVIAGFSGGAAVAVEVGAHWPEVFVGTLDQCRAVMWELHDIATMPGYAFGLGEVDHLDPDYLDTIQLGHRFAFVSGDRDVLDSGGQAFSNYEGILKGLGDWWERDLRARLWDVEGQAHARAGAMALDSALTWILDCEDDGAWPARFDSDHMPPHTPVATPEAEPPPSCGGREPAPTGDTGEPVGDDPAPEAQAAQGGCGCDQSRAGSAMGLVLALALALRRRTPGSPCRTRPASSRRPRGARSR